MDLKIGKQTYYLKDLMVRIVLNTLLSLIFNLLSRKGGFWHFHEQWNYTDNEN